MGRNKTVNVEVEVIFFFICLVFLLASLVSSGFAKSVDEREVNVIITNDNKFIVPNVEGRRTIFCITAKENEDVQYQVADSLFKFRFDSDEFWGKFNRDIEDYDKVEVKFTIAGCLNHFFSWYPNIYEYDIIEDSEFNKLKTE